MLELVDWCEQAAVRHLTVWLLSTDNLVRADDELIPIYRAIMRTAEQLRDRQNTRVVHVGSAGLLPNEVGALLERIESETESRTGITVNLAIAYGGKQEIADALKAWLLHHSASSISLDELASHLTPDELDRHTYTQDQPPLDLVIRTSGEQRLSGFMLWQSTYAELYFCEALWPDFRRIDLWRALRDYAIRRRLFGR